MASEIAHVVYAARVLTSLGKSVRDNSFWTGALFPNIVQLGSRSRYPTHPKNVTLSSLKGKSDFMTGMRVHAWLDATREHYLTEQNIKETLPWHPFTALAFSLVEDEVLYEKFEDWNVIRRILDRVQDEELHYIHSRPHVQAWHTALQQYFKDTPSDDSRQLHLQTIGLTPSSADEVNMVVKRIRDEGTATELLVGFWNYLDELLK